MRIIGLFPLTGNGGIASWTKKFIQTFPDEEFQYSFINVAPKKPRSGGDGETLMYRIVSGLTTMFRILKELRTLLKRNHYDILHTTTSGNLGTLRDHLVAKLCKQYNVKTIMHCRYGCITEDVQSKGLLGGLLRKTMAEYNQIWVLDSHSYKTLRGIPNLKDKVYLTPNSIDVTYEVDPAPKEYKRVAFVGNLVPSKGLYELIMACIKADVRLDIIGPGTNQVLSHIDYIAGESLNKTIFLHGRLPNAEAVNFLRQVDIVALPTYYPSEAFPISIIEAMSLSKLVISCARAAIEDMLTDVDGRLCGILVEPKSVDAIVHAITWCQLHKCEADKMCMKAYEKVKQSYSKEIVYDIYRANYRKLLRP